MLGAIESLISGVVADGKSGTRHHTHQELIGQGYANILSPLCGGFAATGAIARTATNIRNGGTSPLAGLIHAATLVAVLLILPPLAASIPLASLAAVLFVVSWNMRDAGRFAAIMRTAPIADRWILLITFLLTVFVDLIVAVNVGVVLAVLQFLRRMAETVETQPTGAHDLKTELSVLGMTHLPADIQVYEITGPMFFGAIENITRPLLEIRPYTKTLIIRLDRVPFVDITGIQSLGETSHQLRKKGITVVLCDANQRGREKRFKAGLLEGSSADECTITLGQAIAQRLPPHLESRRSICAAGSGGE